MLRGCYKELLPWNLGYTALSRQLALDSAAIAGLGLAAPHAPRSTETHDLDL